MDSKEINRARKLSADLAGMDLPEYERFRVHDAFTLMDAIVMGSNKQGQFYAEPQLLVRLFWWQICETDYSDIQAWLDDLVDWGEIVINEVAFNAYGGVHPILRIVNRKRFKRFQARQAIPRRVRDEVFAADNYQCRFCGSMERLSIDHIVPHSRGGSDDRHNLQTLCMGCNIRKGNRIGLVQGR